MTEQSFFPPLLDLPTADVQTCKQHLLAEIRREPERNRLSWPRVPSIRVVLAIGLVAAATCSVIGVVVFGDHASPSAGRTAGAVGPTGQKRPSKTIALSDASTTLGAPVVLPDTTVVSPSDAASEARAIDCPGDTADTQYPCVVVVSFPVQSIWIQYVRPVPADEAANGDPGVWFDYPGVKSGVELFTGGTRIDVFTTRPDSYDEADFQAMAQSILDRSK